jgi:hypothetical protein
MKFTKNDFPTENVEWNNKKIGVNDRNPNSCYEESSNSELFSKPIPNNKMGSKYIAFPIWFIKKWCIKIIHKIN